MRHAQNKTHVTIGVADWHLVRGDRHDIRLASLDHIAAAMPQKADVSFYGLPAGKMQMSTGFSHLDLFGGRDKFPAKTE